MNRLSSNMLKRGLLSLLPSGMYLFVRTNWRRFLRIRKEGFLHAYKRWRLWCRILAAPPVLTDALQPDCEFAVHLMCYRGDYLCAIWALKSFYHHAKRAYPLVLHIQGKSTRTMEKRLRAHFPNARVILNREADSVVEPYLREHKLTRLLQMRNASPIVQKLTDILVAARSKNILILDSDVLFFKDPKELTTIARNGRLTAMFQRDFIDAYVISRARARADFGIDLQPQINTGIVVLSPSVIDLKQCEEYLGHTDLKQLSGHTEQTLYALEASRNNAVTYLPSSYRVSGKEPLDCATLKARHYAGLSRSLFTREGIPYLLQSGFLQALEDRRCIDRHELHEQVS